MPTWLQEAQKATRKPPESYKKFQGRNQEVFPSVFWMKLIFHKDILKLTDLTNVGLHKRSYELTVLIYILCLYRHFRHAYATQLGVISSLMQAMSSLWLRILICNSFSQTTYPRYNQWRHGYLFALSYRWSIQFYRNYVCVGVWCTTLKMLQIQVIIKKIFLHIRVLNHV